MAPKKSETKSAEMNSELLEKLAQMAPVSPELYAHRPEVDGVPNPIAGILMERREVTYKDGRSGGMFLLATTAQCYLWGDDGEAFEAPKGSFALVPERAGLKDLGRYLPTHGSQGFDSVCEIIVKPLRKVQIGGGKTMWKFETFARKIAAKDSPVTLLAAPTSSAPLLGAAHEADDVIPF